MAEVAAMQQMMETLNRMDTRMEGLDAKLGQSEIRDQEFRNQLDSKFAGIHDRFIAAEKDLNTKMQEAAKIAEDTQKEVKARLLMVEGVKREVPHSDIDDSPPGIPPPNTKKDLLQGAGDPWGGDKENPKPADNRASTQQTLQPEPGGEKLPTD